MWYCAVCTMPYSVGNWICRTTDNTAVRVLVGCAWPHVHTLLCPLGGGNGCRVDRDGRWVSHTQLHGLSRTRVLVLVVPSFSIFVSGTLSLPQRPTLLARSRNPKTQPCTVQFPHEKAGKRQAEKMSTLKREAQRGTIRTIRAMRKYGASKSLVRSESDAVCKLQ